MPYSTYPTYDDQNYRIRHSINFGMLSGNAAVSKYVTYANFILKALNAYMDTIGTSTYSATTSAQTVSLYAVSNTSTTTTVALTTTTFGPYVVGGAGTVSQAGGSDALSLSNAMIPAYSELYVQLGTDATAKVVVSVDYELQHLASVLS